MCLLFFHMSPSFGGKLCYYEGFIFHLYGATVIGKAIYLLNTILNTGMQGTVKYKEKIVN